MKKRLFLCNTVYQVLVAMWIKYVNFNDDSCDVILSNHMKGFKSIAENLEKTKIFKNVYTVESYNYSYGISGFGNKLSRSFYKRFPNLKLKKFIKLNSKYDELYFSNCDMFTSLLYNALVKKNKHIKLYMFEDGSVNYSMLIKQFYEQSRSRHGKAVDFVLKYILGEKYIYGNVSAMCVFNPEDMEWKPDFPVNRIPKIDCGNIKFKNAVNTTFGYENLTDSYDEKYIFFEEAYYAESGYTEDFELVKRLADIVGRENIFIKIHPRNPVNRFREAGFKTNNDTAIPWEVIALNKDLSDKRLVTIASSSILNPVSVLNSDVKCCALINCVSEKPDLLNGPLGKTVLRLFEKYDKIKICSNVEDVVK